jgi:hypothetical protein
LPVLLHHDARSANHLSRVALPVNLAQASPCAEDLGITDLDQVDVVLSAESLDELDVLCFGAGLHEDAEVGIALVQSLGALAEATSKTVVLEGVLQNLLRTKNNVSASGKGQKSMFTHLKSVLKTHFPLGSFGRGGLDLDLLSRGVDSDFISSVRHPDTEWSLEDPTQ